MNHRSTTAATHHNRHQLFGESAAPHTAANMRNNNNNKQSTSEQARTMMQESNDRDISQLSDKVQHMRNIAFDLEQQLQEDHALLNQTGSNMDRVSQMMRTTLGNVTQMLNTGGSKHMCYLILFIVCLFLGLYSLMK